MGAVCSASLQTDQSQTSTNSNSNTTYATTENSKVQLPEQRLTSASIYTDQSQASTNLNSNVTYATTKKFQVQLPAQRQTSASLQTDQSQVSTNLNSSITHGTTKNSQLPPQRQISKHESVADNQINVVSNLEKQPKPTESLATKEQVTKPTTVVNFLKKETELNEQNAEELKLIGTLLTRNEDVNKKIPKFQNLYQIFEGFKEFKNKAENRRFLKKPFEIEKSANLLRILKSKIHNPFDAYKKQNERKIMGNYLAAIGLPYELFWIYKTITPEYFPEFSNSIYEEENYPEFLVCSCIRDIFKNYTDYSGTFAESLAVDTEMFGYYANDLKYMDNKESKMLCNQRGSFNQAVFTLCNCGRHRVSRRYFTVYYYEQHYDMSTILKPFSKSEIQEVKLIATIARSYMVSSSEMKNELSTDEVFLEYLLDVLSEAVHSKVKQIQGLCLEDLLNFFTKIAQNDDNKKMLGKIRSAKFEESIFDLLRKALGSKSSRERIAAVNTIWELSFDKENASLFFNDKEIMNYIKRFKKSTKKALAKPSLFACFEIENKMKFTLPSTKNKEYCEKNKMFMISYHPKDMEKVHKIFDILEDIGCTLTNNKDQMTGSNVYRMEEFVSTADIILVCYSELYETDRYCKTEANLAFKEDKELFFFNMDCKYKPPDGCWLDIMENLNTSYKIENNDYRKSIDKLLQDLKKNYPSHTLCTSPEKLTDSGFKKESPHVQNVKTSPNQIAPVNNRSSNSVVGQKQASRATTFSTTITVSSSIEYAIDKANTLKTWGNEDLENWSLQNNLHMSPEGILTVQVLQFLIKIYIRAPKTFDRIVRENFKFQTVEELVKMRTAIEELMGVHADTVMLHKSGAVWDNYSTQPSFFAPLNQLVPERSSIQYAIAKTNKLKTWGNADLEEWLFKNQINTLLGANQSIKSVQFFMKLYIRAPETFQRVVKDELNICRMDEVKKFKQAIGDLMN